MDLEKNEAATQAAGAPRPEGARQAVGDIQEQPAKYGETRHPGPVIRDIEDLSRQEIGGQEAEWVAPFWKRAPGVVTTNLQALVNWGRSNAMWLFPVGTACCAIEGLMAVMGPKFDFDRHGMPPWFSPRQCDVMLVAGTVTERMAPAVRTIYEQMPEPRWVVAIGGCAINGGPFYEGYNVVDGVDKIVPVDIYVPGCPPRPEAVVHGLYRLREKIAKNQGPSAADPFLRSPVASTSK